MRYSSVMLVMTGALAISGCSAISNFRSRSANDGAVLYRIPVDQPANASAAADKYCQRFGNSAQVKKVTPMGAQVTTVSFTCG